MNEGIYRAMAAKIPAPLKKRIVEERLIDRAMNIPEPDTPMEFLFDVYEEFVDVSGEHDDWQCWRCRQEVLNNFRLIKEFL